MRPPIVVLLLGLALASCGGEPTSPTDDPEVAIVPSNLTLDVALRGDQANGYGDGSGIVFLDATGTNAAQFRFRFDDGTTEESRSGRLTHTFTHEGTRARRITVVAYSTTGHADSTATTVTVRVASPSRYGMTQVWEDEFDYDGPVDPAKWHHQVIPIAGDSWANNEVQHYTDRTDNSYVSDGTLKIVARRESYQFQGVAKSYTSARLNSIFAFRYGRIDIRAKLPAQAGTWPAFWTLGANIDEVGNYHGDEYGSVGWPACGEIDIMEQTGWDKDRLIGHLHWGDTQTGAYQNQGGVRAVTNLSTSFNLYSLVWTRSTIQVLFNDEVVFQAPNATRMPFDNLHYVLLNIAMGGNLGGPIPADFSEAVMEVDYIRIYQ